MCFLRPTPPEVTPRPLSLELTPPAPGRVLDDRVWGDIDLDARRIRIQRQVRHGRLGPPKIGKDRLVPIADLLAKVLAEWKVEEAGAALPPRQSRARGPQGLSAAVHEPAHRPRKLKACGLPTSLTLYHSTRHTSQFVVAGGSLAHLREILGHSSVLVTERYGHLRSSLLRPADLPALTVDLSRPGVP